MSAGSLGIVIFATTKIEKTAVIKTVFRARVDQALVRDSAWEVGPGRQGAWRKPWFWIITKLASPATFGSETLSKPELVKKILEILRREQVPVGFHIREQWLADRLGVSRSPIRTAFKELEGLGLLRSEQNQGYFLAVDPEAPDFGEAQLPQSSEERIYRQIASERFARLLGEQISVAELVRRYRASRSTVLKVLTRMQEEGLVEKSAGHGWTFGPALNDEEAYQESYRFRLLVEPAAVLEPNFILPPQRLAGLRERHENMIQGAVFSQPVAALFDLDAAFHDTIAEACGNRFLAQAIRQQTRLRRLSEYERYSSRERLLESFREHLRVLEALEQGDKALAADCLRVHIRASENARPDLRKVRVLAHRRLTRR